MEVIPGVGVSPRDATTADCGLLDDFSLGASGWENVALGPRAADALTDSGWVWAPPGKQLEPGPV